MGGLAPRPHTAPVCPSDQSKFNVGSSAWGLGLTVTPRAEYMCAFMGMLRRGGGESKETHKIAQEAVLLTPQARVLWPVLDSNYGTITGHPHSS